MMEDGSGWEMGWATGENGVLLFALVAPIAMAITSLHSHRKTPSEHESVLRAEPGSNYSSLYEIPSLIFVKD